ncbi:PitA Phosphate sulfate permease [Pyrenophora tritici-repentis]|uniref:Phosphate transporter n=2 Tax=Pyrenophora tritici-repentis TaxID=45151 RepID=A0A2W1FBY6_9PLEO|nr:phosphate permease (PHO89 /Pi cotransporter PHO89) [Pyrenophora tritici-repentis Pt-1C-BFP]KAA8613557.1 sodium/phosphate symporter [Pyrenophora tritici-repentis]EDU49395.1 phosphate permease (PHO89 /Pi cotransporter PHO89) [Pyrenophora tritici-repentis Pt-1C-BFP]KAF7445267.1 sodium/phosphate symporter [Pyrenophora tritici-repentis]KAF7565532.1 PitA, Phosphate-sulfate permease [Pyrenophora tritici-repentis]KAI0580713.1 sodium/phosphate symporter [Pyrenophora tritici-repentis]
MARLTQYNYVFAIGTFFAMLDAYNNGANDVANAWATSVSSRSVSYRQAMILGTIFEMVGAITVGARTADTIKNGIIPTSAFKGDAGVQMLAFTCALAGASLWVMWCTKHSAHVSSSYSLISSVAGVGVAVAGASNVQWGWNKGKGLGAIFAGLGMAPAASACFGAIIYMLIKLTVHLRKNPIPWAIWTAPFFFLVAGTVCTLSIVYKGSPNLGLNKKPAWYVAAVTLSCGFGLAFLSFVFFVPYLYAKVVKRDATVRWYHVIQGPLLFKRPAQDNVDAAVVPDYAVVQDDDEIKPEHSSDSDIGIATETEKGVVVEEHRQLSYKELVAQGQERFHAKLRSKNDLLGWAMRYLHENKIQTGEIYEKKNMVITLKRIPAMLLVGCLYGLNYDIHAAQTGIHGTPEGKRMERVYAHAKKYPNEVEHTYSFVQVLTACTASFAHGANDIGNAVGPWAVIYSAWNTGNAAQSKAPVPLWQLAVLSATLSLGLITYGYNIMKVMGNKITYHSPSRGCSMEMGAALTVLIFSQYSLPVSTSMCITGATVGVGLCNGTYKAVNWQRVGLLVFSWIMTIPIAGTIGGLSMGIILNAPHFNTA